MSQPIGIQNIKLQGDYKNCRIGIVAASWNADVVEPMIKQCLEVLSHYQIPESAIKLVQVPGSFEIPFVANEMSLSEIPYSAIICFGCIIKGETNHDKILGQAVTDALVQLSMSQESPIILGVLTTENKQQAIERVNGVVGKKGEECAISALQMIEIKRNF